MPARIRLTIWNEYRHERQRQDVAKVYPEGIHGASAEFVGGQDGISVRTATLDEPDHGLSEAVLAETDVLTWWGHAAHDEVREEIVDRLQGRILQGMGLIVLHSGHFSKIFRRMMGTTCQLKWREAGEREVLWVTSPAHPIARGIDECFTIEHTEMYGEHFDIPQPDETVFISSFAGGEVFRSGVCFRRGAGRIFYFRPGHETFPIYRQPEVLRIIANAVRWAAPTGTMKMDCPNKPMGWFEGR